PVRAAARRARAPAPRSGPLHPRDRCLSRSARRAPNRRRGRAPAAADRHARRRARRSRRTLVQVAFHQRSKPMSEFTLTTPSQEPGYKTAMEVVFQWNYDPEVEELRNLYVKAAEAQWISERDIRWDQPIDLVKFSTTPLGTGVPIDQTSYWKSLPQETRLELTRRTAAFRLSQFLHGQQGA